MDNEKKETSTCFLYGKWFDYIEEMIQYGIKFKDMPLDLEFYERFLADRLKEAKINKKFNPNFTNRQAFLLLRMNTDWAKHPIEDTFSSRCEDD